MTAFRFSQRTLDLWTLASRLLDDDSHDAAELLEVERALDDELSIPPWQSSPLSVRHATAPGWCDERARDDWARAWRLRRALEQATAAVPKRRARS